MKPLVFFSHSSRDADTLVRLRAFLLDRTAGEVEIFLSSDGESLTYGRDWATQIVAKLHEARAVFAFLSPHSLTSQWLFFEAGMAFERKTDVIPVGLRGVDARAASAPLGPLQGFNLDRPRGLTKLLHLVSRLSRPGDEVAECGLQDFLQLFHRAEIPPPPPGVSTYRVHTAGAQGEIALETITIDLADTRITVRSPEWESVGFLDDSRYVGRFHFHRGGAAEFVGTHDLLWNGHEFRGSARVDSGRWVQENLIWRLELDVDRARS
jgi:hypothetical protein